MNHVNIGIGPNRFLANTAAGLHKPNSLDTIDHINIIDVCKSMELEDINGIADAYCSQFRAHGIMTPMDFLAAIESMLRKEVFRSIIGSYWHIRLREKRVS